MVAPLVISGLINFDKIMVDPQALLLAVNRDDKNLKYIVTNQQRVAEHLTEKI